MIKKKIVVTGGNGELSKSLKKVNKKFNILFPNKNQLNIKKYLSITNYINKKKPDYLIHAAALTTPMSQHNYRMIDSIDLNIIGTSNVAKACHINKVKMIYISTNFVYPGKKGNYKEEDSLNPVNKYGWSKLGGECATMLIDNNLILRVCMSNDKFPHKVAYSNYLTSFLTKTNVAKIILKLLNNKGVINIGGKTQSAYNFAKKLNKSINKSKVLKKDKKLLGNNTSLNINKLKKILSK